MNTLVPVIMMIGVLLGALLEPIYDFTFYLHWYIEGQWNLYQAFNTYQPIWIGPAYVSTYGFTALQIYKKLQQAKRERHRTTLTNFMPILVISYLVYVVIFTNMGVYEYYGEHPFRLFNFPAWITLPNLAVAAATGVMASFIHSHTKGSVQILAALFVFPLCMAKVRYTVALPLLVYINAGPVISVYMSSLAILVSVLSLVVIWMFLKGSLDKASNNKPRFHRRIDLTQINE